MRKLGTIINAETWKMPVDEALSVIRQAGFDAFFPNYQPHADIEARMEQYADSAARHGLYFESIHAPFKNIQGEKAINAMWLSGEEGDIMLGHLLDCVRTCKRHGVPIAVVHLSAGEGAPCVSDIGHARYDRLVDEAVKLGVTLAFENQRKIGNLAFVLELYDKVPEVRFCWDMGHEACNTPEREYMLIFGKKLAYTHIHDNMGFGKDMHMIPFDGVIDFGHKIELLRRYSYQGTLTLEIQPKVSGRYDNLSAREFYARGYAAACRLREMLDGTENK